VGPGVAHVSAQLARTSGFVKHSLRNWKQLAAVH
jgi:hypothetical protein